MHGHPARLLQSFQTKRRRGDLGLLVSCLSEICAEGAPQPFEPEQRDRRRPRRVAAIAQA